MTQKILITSALPYANGPLHFGHIAGAYLPADCYARFQRLLQNDVLYICGSDEFGVAITMSAELAGRDPKSHVDLFHEINRQFFDVLQISFDHYSRTTWKGHVEATQQYFLDLLANGYIEERTTEQLYSDTDDKFLADRYVTGTCPRCGYEEARGDECTRCGASYEATDLKNPRSKITKAPLVRRPTKHWFLLLEQFKEKLKNWIDTKDWKQNVTHFIKDYIDHMHARAITRDSTWGIPIPLSGTEGKVLYVWFDAPIGYISATKEWALSIQQPDRWKEYWCDSETKLVQFIGKDNIPFHASIFPAMTMGQNQPYKLVDELPANEFYNLEGRQFSKSDGWTIDLDHFFENFTSDQIRFVIGSNAPETSDSEFTWKDFQNRCNSELLGKYGNLVNRILTFIVNRCEGKNPPSGDLEAIDVEFLQNIRTLADQAAESYEHFKVRRASSVVMELAQLGNVYFDQKRPWADVKDPATRGRMNTTLNCCLQCLKTLALISSPIIPTTAEKVWQMLGFKESMQELGWKTICSENIPTGQLVQHPEILFKKVENEQISIEMEKLRSLLISKQQLASKEERKGFGKAVTPPLKSSVAIGEFQTLDLRVATVLKADPVPKSKKLLRLEVDIGLETRIIVAGIAASYSPECLIGKKIVIVANLQPATIMGIESQGMVLAAKSGELCELLSPEEASCGSIVS